MTFCDNCGSYMKETSKGLLCPRCGRLVPSETKIKTVRRSTENKKSSSIYVVEEDKERGARVAQLCPKCGHKEAFHWVSGIYGEHAGVRRERTVEHFRCAKCSHSWTKSS
jgi:DNA-directed RNA polymerase subunit M/transcription elongation factor TFIIS